MGSHSSWWSWRPLFYRWLFQRLALPPHTHPWENTRLVKHTPRTAKPIPTHTPTKHTHPHRWVPSFPSVSVPVQLIFQHSSKYRQQTYFPIFLVIMYLSLNSLGRLDCSSAIRSMNMNAEGKNEQLVSHQTTLTAITFRKGLCCNDPTVSRLCQSTEKDNSHKTVWQSAVIRWKWLWENVIFYKAASVAYLYCDCQSKPTQHC